MLQKKICLLGASAVGKTSLVRRFVESIYSDGYQTTVGVKIEKKVLKAGGEDVMLLLWDLYGEDDFQKLRLSYLRGAAGFLVVCDGTRKDTLEKALAVHRSAEQEFGKIPAMIAINKSDLAGEWEISQESESSLTQGGWSVIRTSAKSGAGVEEAFQSLARLTLAK